jgi:hypothetical protein
MQLLYQGAITAVAAFVLLQAYAPSYCLDGTWALEGKESAGALDCPAPADDALSRSQGW